MRIGIMGAKGDPWHFMHFLVAETARVQRNLDVVYLVTAGAPVDKAANEVTDKNLRHETCTAVIDGDQYLIPSRVEIDRDGPSYMIDTVRHFKQLHGEDTEIELIIGDDRPATLKSWHKVDELLKLVTVTVAPRLNGKIDEAWLKSVLPEGARYATLELEFSSSFIRKQRKMGRTVRWLVPPEGIEVLDYNNLFAPSNPAPTTNASYRSHNMIRSMLDNDLYKFTMCAAVLRKFPNVRVGYKFTDRKAKGKWTPAAVNELKKRIAAMAGLRLTAAERAYCEEKLPWMNRSFWDFLALYRYDPSEVSVRLTAQNNLEISIAGLWHRTILWEVPILALVCEVFYEMIDTNWTEDGQLEKIEAKAKKLADAGVKWGDFGTRRRRHFAAQERVVATGKKYANFTGTSNVYLAMVHNVNPLGTMAHEWIMAHSALFSLRHANRYALHNWNEVYQGNLGTALPDTFGTDSFLRDFDGVLARLFDSVRHDSGDVYAWSEKMIAHYTKLGIDWKSKPLGYTDGNTAESAIEIHNWVAAKGGKCWFGIGTSMSNDYGDESPALSIVIKLSWVEDPVDGSIIYVVKLSDTPDKASGEEDALRVAKYTHLGTPLDAEKKEATARGAGGSNGVAA